jgi:hypothetical protein
MGKNYSFETDQDTQSFCYRRLCKPEAFSLLHIIEDLMVDKDPGFIEAKSNKLRSFRVLGIFEMSQSSVVDRSSLLNGGRFLINASNGRVSQIGTHAGSMLYVTGGISM